MTSEMVQGNLDLIWIMVAAALVMFMQAGFTALESGVTRAKNTINVAMKNITDFILSILLFWALGYGLMFGADASGLIGTDAFGLAGHDEPMDYATFVFQATFAGTAATIVSGAVAERMKFMAYALVSIVLSAFIYPVSGHWIWGTGGWLAEKGMVDFAGSTVVHSVGAWVGLAGAIMLGPRIGRFNPDGKPNKIHGHSLVLAVVGVLVLWFGWFGFNGGSTLAANVSVAKIIANTMMAAAAGGVACLLCTLLFNSDGAIYIEKLLNGVIGGLVAITAGCAVVNIGGAILIGLSAGVLVYVGEEFILRVCKIDDPVSVVAVHGFAGAWGTLLLALVAPAENLPLQSHLAQFGVQFTGVIAVFLWSFFCGLLLFGIMKFMDFLRVDPEAEQLGLNVHEHGASSSLLETMQAMRNIVEAQKNNGRGDGDLTRRISVETGTEAGDVAHLFNCLMDTFHDTVREIKKSVKQIGEAVEQLNNSSDELNEDTKAQQDNLQQISTAIRQITAAVQDVSRSTGLTVNGTESAVEKVQEGSALANQVSASMQQLAREVAEASNIISQLNQDSEQIYGILETIEGISEQTNLLALNATIEAARAGDSGRGFAVVADEVRKLSVNTQSATEDIRHRVERLKERARQAEGVMRKNSGKADQCVGYADESGQRLEDIRQVVEQICSLSQDVDQATCEQNTSMTAITSSIAHMEQHAQRSAHRITQTRSLSELLSGLAHNLDMLTGNLTVREV